jgi:hypothetical protein
VGHVGGDGWALGFLVLTALRHGQRQMCLQKRLNWSLYASIMSIFSIIFIIFKCVKTRIDNNGFAEVVSSAHVFYISRRSKTQYNMYKTHFKNIWGKSLYRYGINKQCHTSTNSYLINNLEKRIVLIPYSVAIQPCFFSQGISQNFFNKT